eukprot:156559-Rhodomonas_salina.1
MSGCLDDLSLSPSLSLRLAFCVSLSVVGVCACGWQVWEVPGRMHSELPTGQILPGAFANLLLIRSPPPPSLLNNAQHGA